MKNLIKNIFSVTNSYNKMHKIITILGIKLKLKRKSFHEPIDIVYLWCDGNEDEYKKIRNDCLQKQGKPLSEWATNQCRYIDNDELKYSLRSLQKYANWINKIYIVTNGQCPKWLNLKNPRIELIKQKDIMPKEALPNFNSSAIELCIINIKNLTEYFLYANDDQLFCDYVSPQFFFKKEKPIYRFSDKYPKNKNLYTKLLQNSENLIYKKYGKRYDRYPHHNIEPYKKSILKECYEIFKEEIDKTIMSQFRCESDVQKSIYSNYALATKQGIYKILSWKDKKRDSVDVLANNKNAIWRIFQYQPKLFCINDCENASYEDRARVKQILEVLFPEKSEFEI